MYIDVLINLHNLWMYISSIYFWFVYLFVCLSVYKFVQVPLHQLKIPRARRNTAQSLWRGMRHSVPSLTMCATYACYCNLLHCCSMLFVPGFSGRRLEVEANSYRRIGEPTEAPMKRELRRTHEVFTPDMTRHDRDSVRRN